MVLRSSGHSSSIFLEPFAPPELPGFIATMAPLTPAGRVSGARQVSLLHVLNLLTVPSPITLCRSDRLACFLDRTYRRNRSEEPVPPTQAGQRRRQLGFAMGLLARRDKRPYRVRHPTDQSFTSWCSPHPLTGTQFRSVTAVRPTTDRDSHPADSIHSQSHSPRREPGDCDAVHRVAGLCRSTARTPDGMANGVARRPAVPGLAPGACMPACQRRARAASRMDSFPCGHKSPRREPGDCDDLHRLASLCRSTA